VRGEVCDGRLLRFVAVVFDVLTIGYAATKGQVFWFKRVLDLDLDRQLDLRPLDFVTRRANSGQRGAGQ
jgi:hypothetical protein